MSYCWLWQTFPTWHCARCRVAVLPSLTWFRISPFYAVTDGGVAIRPRQICKFLKMWTPYPHSVYSTMIWTRQHSEIIEQSGTKILNRRKVPVSGSRSYKALIAVFIFSLFSSQIFAESKPREVGGLVEVNLEKAQPLFSDHQRVSRDELMEILRSDKLLCYGMSEEGTCEYVEVGQTYHPDGFTSVNFYLTSSDASLLVK